MNIMTHTVIDLTKQAGPESGHEWTQLKAQVARAYGIGLVMVIQQAEGTVFEILAKVLREPFIEQIILVDNGNSDVIRKGLVQLEQVTSRIRLVQPQYPMTQAAALNRAVEQIEQPYILILDQRYGLMENASWRLLVAGQMLSGPWILGVKRQGVDGRELPSCTYLPNPKEVYRQLWGRRLQIPMSVARNSRLHPYYVPAANASCIFMPKSVFEKMQGWNFKTTIWGGYGDFCLRLHQQAGHVYYLPEVQVREQGVFDLKQQWRYQLESAYGLVRYFGDHYAQTSRLIRWPLAFFVGLTCFLTPYLTFLKARWLPTKCRTA